MLKPSVYHPHTSSRTLLPKPFIHGDGQASLHQLIHARSSFTRTQRKIRLGHRPTGSIKACVSTTAEQSVKVKAIVTVKPTVGGFLSGIGLEKALDDIQDYIIGKTLLLEFVSAELDPKTGSEKPTIKAYAHRLGSKGTEIKYEADFVVPPSFGDVGAVLVENEHHTEMFLKDIVLDGFPAGPVNVTCNSWVHSKFDNKYKRVFFTTKSYLPSETPNGLKRLRQEELVLLRGNGEGERKKGDRIYDYAMYNDLGDPDKSADLARPVLGGQERPYPRRCRTGNEPTKSDPLTESRGSYFYVPRDEEFAEVKGVTFSAKTVYSVLHAVVPALQTVFVDADLGFPYFTAIDSMFNEGVELPPQARKGGWSTLLPRLINTIKERAADILKFEPPPTMDRDKFFWFRDSEFARQTLAGINPCVIQAVTEWPLKSKLDPKIYGPPESAITGELIEREIKGFCTVEEAIAQRKLFIIDYHDTLMPYVKKIRELEGTTLYGSRAVFFLTLDGTLRPLAIELTRPPMDGKPQWKQVFTPTWDATGVWLWRFAKAHFLAHDSGIHQLISHWLRTHCCAEPYIIATNRQLSALHPIYRLLLPHFRYTMEINALAREALINSGGIIETSFSPLKYSIELSSVVYDQQWRFDHQSLPKDLISRGMAVADPSAPYGLKLAVEDYPYAADGLILWDCIQEWVSEYVNYYYPDQSLVKSDQELQKWWWEIRNVGHGDKKDEPWWPELNTNQDLVEILTVIIWTVSGHHAAVNFGQYAFAGYFPNRPTIARKNMPNEDPTDEEWKLFMENPDDVLLRVFPSQIQATIVMAVLDVLSSHSPDEEYIGKEIEPAWADDPFIKGAFEKFNGRLKELEGIIDQRNSDVNLKNRYGAGVVPYELLKPFSEPGVTGKGVPYSISI